VKQFPETPPLSDASLSGHLWIQEHVTGLRIRFRVAPSGMLTFGAPREVFDADGVPLPYRRATAHVREALELSALRSATDEPESVTFFGVATLHEGIEYEWSELPPFVGVDVWSDERDAYLPPDGAARAYEAVGLPSLPAVEKEADADYTDLDGYAAGEMPTSAYRDGPAAGVLVRDKSDGRGVAWREEVVETDTEGTEETPEDLAERYATEERIDRTAETLVGRGEEPTVEAVLERLLVDVVRKNYTNLYAGGESVVSEKGFRSAVAERAKRRLG
jgi:hypothetical protein